MSDFCRAPRYVNFQNFLVAHQFFDNIRLILYLLELEIPQPTRPYSALLHTRDSNTFHHIHSKVYFQKGNNMLSVLSLFFLSLCDFYLICSALVFHEWWKDIGIKALTNFPSILHDGNCTNIVFVEDLRHQESFDAIRQMFLNVMTEEAYSNYLTYITIR